MESSQRKNSFVRANEKYSLAEKMELGELVNKYKEEYDKELKDLEGKTSYDYKRKKHVPMKPKQGFLTAAVRNFYTDLLKVKHDDPNLVKALKFAKRCHEKYLSNEFLEGEQPPKKKFRESGAGRKASAPEVREAMFQWFIDVRQVLKGRLPVKMFRSKCLQVYSEWLKQQPEVE